MNPKPAPQPAPHHPSIAPSPTSTSLLCRLPLTPFTPLTAFICLLPIICGTAATAQDRKGVGSLWENNCLSCHGDRGQGGGAGTSTLLTNDLFDQKYDRPFYDAIRDGVKDAGMPAFRGALNNEQAWGLVVYIRELQAKNLRKRPGPLVAPPLKDGIAKARDHSFTIQPVISAGLDVPWAVDFLPADAANPAGAILITERNGNLRIFAQDKLSEPLTNLPQVRNRGQGGLMDIAVHPDYKTNGWIYLSYSHGQGDRNRLGMTRLVRGKIADGNWTSQQTIFEAREEHYLPTDLHFGSRTVFSPPVDGTKRYIYFSIGDRGRQEMAQDLSRPNGKIFRVWEDGSIPTDNPFIGKQGQNGPAYEAIWSYGHRNPQGLTLGLDGLLWNTEHGPRGGDEVNNIKPGKNYGWPKVAYSINYSGVPGWTPWQEPTPEPTSEPTSQPTPEPLEQPVMRWMPAIGACGLDIVRGTMFPAWKGDLVAGGLSGQNVDRIRVDATGLIEREELIYGMGRVRDVVCGPEGAIYVVLNDPDTVIKLVQAPITPP